MIDLGKDPNGDPYDLDLRNSGSGWTGTFAGIIRRTVEDITDDGPWSPAEVTLSDGTVLAGELDVWPNLTDDGSFIVTEPNELPRIVEVDDVVRFRA